MLKSFAFENTSVFEKNLYEIKDYQKQTVKNLNIIKRFVHLKRFFDALRLLQLTNDDTLLDYGTGDGMLLKLSSKFLSPEKIFGYEPSSKMFAEARSQLTNDDFHLYKNIHNIPDIKFTKITCLETCEHLSNRKLFELFENICAIASKNTQILISVPIEIGTPAFLKNIYRFITNKNGNKNLSFVNTIKSFFGLKVERESEDTLGDVGYIFSHVGFDYREFKKLLSRYFVIHKTHYSPFPFFGRLFNCTVYFTIYKK